MKTIAIAVLSIAALIGVVAASEWYRPITTLVVTRIADGIAKDRAERISAPSPFEDVGPDRIVAESENAIVFADRSPQAPHHYLIVPKKRVVSVLDADAELLGEMLALASRFARSRRIADDGFRIVINTNPRGLQSAYHLHMHLLGGRQMLWPPG